MGLGLFDILNDQELMKTLRAQKERNDVRNDSAWELAIDFLENKQKAHTEQELKRRYPERQQGDKGAQIQAFTLPMTERYVVEAASAYNHTVARDLVDDKGKIDAKATEALTAMTEDAGLNESLHSLEQRAVLLDSSVLLPGARRGDLTTQILTPQQVHPVLPWDASDANPADQRDYLGHVVDLGKAGPNPNGGKEESNWVFITSAAHYYYKSTDWSEVRNVKTVPNETWLWEQSRVTNDFKYHPEDLPLQLLTYWHRSRPVGHLIPPTDAPVASMNLELNVQWSGLMDTLRMQGFGQLVMHLTDPTKAPAQRAIGTAFATMLHEEETITSIAHSNDWAGMLSILKSLSKFFAILLRQSPTDFAIDAKGPESGFAKLVDSFPKIEARSEHIRRFTIMEEQHLWPRLASIGIYLGKLPEHADKLHMRTTFSEVEYPQTIQEKILEQDQDLKLGFTTPAGIYAKRNNVPLNEAQKIIDKNLAASEPTKPEPVAAPVDEPEKSRSLTAALVAGQKRTEVG